MEFDWQTYCLQWVSVILSFGLVWPLIGACIDMYLVESGNDKPSSRY